MSDQEIVDVYKMGLGCIDKIEKFIKEFGNKCEFSKRPSFLYTNKKSGIEAIKKEYLFRIKHELDAKFISQTSNPFPFPIKAGLYCKNGGAEFNPYLFAVQMLENSKNQDKMFENTEIISVIEKNDSFIAITNLNQKINCKKIIFATGYNFELLTDIKLCERTISYSIVTNPLQIELPNNCLIQDDEIPYHYLRLLPDNRTIFGGEDTVYKTKINQKLAEKKYEKLLKDLKKMFNFKDSEIKIDYKFCGAFGQTENNLGLIGQTENPNIYLMISSGANGVINAMYGVEILGGLINNKPKPLSHLFSPLR